MANEVQTPPEQSVTTLVSGILQDAQDLIKQQLTLVRSEIQSDLRKTREAAVSLGLGVGVCAAAGLLLCLMLVHLLHYLTAPAGYDPAEVPLWACFAIVGGVLAAVGGTLVVRGIWKFESFNPLPDQSVEALGENLQWRTNPNPR